MGFVRDVKAGTMGTAARQAREAGQKIFVCRINVPVGQAQGFSGEIKDISVQVQAIEEAGWVLDQASFTTDKRGNPEGYFVFALGRRGE